MKFSAWQQSYMNRRTNSLRSSGPLDSSSDSSIKSPWGIFWLVLHGLCCLISLVLGFRFSRLVFFFIFSTSATTNLYTSSFRTASELAHTLTVNSNPLNNVEWPQENRTAVVGGISSRVVVGRHGIRIRPWPHPNPVEVMRAHQIIERVQREQRLQFGVKNPRTVIAVTPTYVRTFQALHLTGVMHSLMLVPYDVVWIVVEAGRATNETASILSKSGLSIVHVGFHQRMPNSWEGRHRLEARMRLHALSIVKEKKLDGIVIFADDSNMHSMELFDEIQNVKWIGALSVGILAHSGDTDDSSANIFEKKKDEKNPSMPVQGPACNSSNQLVGWHTFDSQPFVGKSATYIGDKAIVLPRKLEWAGFVLNSQLLWEDAEDRPEWVKYLDALDHIHEDIESPLFLLKDVSVVEPLGSCGRQILLWWLRVEARADSKFPPGSNAIKFSFWNKDTSISMKDFDICLLLETYKVANLSDHDYLMMTERLLAYSVSRDYIYCPSSVGFLTARRVVPLESCLIFFFFFLFDFLCPRSFSLQKRLVIFFVYISALVDKLAVKKGCEVEQPQESETEGTSCKEMGIGFGEKVKREMIFNIYYSEKWIIDPPLEITVPSKRTPWPDAPPELPSTEKVVIGVQERAVEHSSKSRTSRSRRSSRSKRKRDPKIVDTQVRVRHSEQN
ncbi:putative beta-1,4-xylosyltransferase IRX14H [Morella rubra]|uniref:Glycosyltransferases n=1 Tax=Morella rubra TaxID=262757 RepID=A0A6A1VT86_9ROSI|nr:putative beta-1,4-xylosyltransferase IRX14H [Morella rubra]